MGALHMAGSVCMAYEYKCTSGQCVPADSPCNGTRECDDGSDEAECSCKRGEFRCRDKHCITLAQRCNGFIDCEDGEDEFNCGEYSGWALCFLERYDKFYSFNKCLGSCPAWYWQCADGRCIKNNTVCDGRSDCRDNSDERYCQRPETLSKGPLFHRALDYTHVHALRACIINCIR